MVSPISVRDLPAAFLEVDQQKQAKAAAIAQQNQNEYWKAKIAAGAPEADVAQTVAQTGLTQQQTIAAQQTNQINQMALRDAQLMRGVLRQTIGEAQPVAQPAAPEGVVPIPPAQPAAPVLLTSDVVAPAVPATQTLTGQGVPAVAAVPPAAPAAPVQPMPGQAVAPPVPVQPAPAGVVPEAPTADIPVPPQRPSSEEAIKGPLLGGKPNYWSDAHVNRVVGLAREAGVSEPTIQTYVEGVLTKRGKLAKDVQDLENDVQSGRKTREDANKEAILNRNNTVHDALQQWKTGSSVDRQVAETTLANFNIDPTTPAGMRRAEDMQAAAPNYISARKAATEEDKDRAGIKKSAADAVDVKDVAPGYYRVGAEYFKKGKDGREIQVTSTEAVTGSTEPLPPNAIAQRFTPAEKSTATDLVRNITATQENVARQKELYTKIWNDYTGRNAYDPTDSKYMANFKTWWMNNVDNTPEVREYNNIMQQMVNQNLRMNKGVQTDADAARERAALTTIGLPPETHTAIIDRINRDLGRGRQRAIGITKGYILTSEEVPGPSANRPAWQRPAGQAAGAAANATPSAKTINSQADYDALPSGAVYVDSNGRHARKK